MSNGDLNWIANFIWGIADDVLRDLYVRGKNRDVIYGQSRNLNQAIAYVEREVALFQEFRSCLIANVVTGKLDVCAVAANLPKVSAPGSLDELIAEQDLDEAAEEAESEKVAA